jgi:hypothetical protein
VSTAAESLKESGDGIGTRQQGSLMPSSFSIPVNYSFLRKNVN